MDVVNFLKDKTRVPVIGAPLFTVSYPELVLAPVSYTHLTLPTNREV